MNIIKVKNKAQKTEKMSAKKNNKYINKFVLNLQDGIVSDEMLNSYFCNTLFKVKSFEDYVDLINNTVLNRAVMLSLSFSMENLVAKVLS